MKINDPEFTARFPRLANHLTLTQSFKTRNQNTEYIRKMSLTEMTQIILEMRKAIIEEVQQTISDRKLPLVFLIGGTGSGKSTTFCFLRGDEMSLNGFQYDSKNDQTGALIGHELATSCTFLPNIAFTNDFILIDFPGFDDTNGPLVHMGAELALRALLAQYNSKVMVIESITNTSDRYSAIEGLAYRLKRLFKNPEDCLLGLTKYSKMVASSEEINKTEETIQKLTRFNQWIPLKNLEDKRQLETVRRALTSPSIKSVEVNSQYSLNAYDEKLLRDRFDAHLEEMYSSKMSIPLNRYANLTELCDETSKTSFISATQPQLREFFHLQEIDPSLLNDLDKKIVTYCLQRYINAVVSLDLRMCKEHLKRLEKNTHVLVLEESILTLENYTRRLLGISDDKDKEWNDYVMTHGQFRKSAEELFKLPNWAQPFPFIPTETPNTVYDFARNLDWDHEHQQMPLETIGKFIEEIEQVKNTLVIFARIKNTVCCPFLSEFSKPSVEILQLDSFQRKQANLVKMLMLNHFIQTSQPVNKALNLILDKAINLEKRGFHQAATAIHHLVEQLIVSIDNHTQTPPSKDNDETFINTTSLAIQQANDVLKEHRDCHYLLANLGLAFAGLGIFYGIALIVNRVQTGHWLFFDKTDSVKKLDEVKTAFDLVCPK